MGGVEEPAGPVVPSLDSCDIRRTRLNESWQIPNGDTPRPGATAGGPRTVWTGRPLPSARTVARSSSRTVPASSLWALQGAGGLRAQGIAVVSAKILPAESPQQGAPADGARVWSAERRRRSVSVGA